MRAAFLEREAAFRDAEEHGALGSDRVHHGAHVVHALLERGQLGGRHAIRHAGAALVEHDKPAERCEPAQEVRELRVFPRELDVGEPAGHEDEIERPFADDVIGDVDEPLFA